MTSSNETPILIDSDDDSDVEILREEKNEDLDVIFVSETINVKDKTCSEVPSAIPKTETGLNRTLSISSSLDVTLHLNDNPFSDQNILPNRNNLNPSVTMVTDPPPLLPDQNNAMKQSGENRTWLETTIGESLKLSALDRNILVQNNVHLHQSDQLPLDLTSKADYDDISDSSDEDSLSSSSSEGDDDDDDNGDIFSKEPGKTTVLSMPALTDLSYNSDGTSINCTGTDPDIKPFSLVGKSKSVNQGTSQSQIGQATNLQQFVPCTKPADTFKVQYSTASKQGTSQPDVHSINSFSASTSACLQKCSTPLCVTAKSSGNSDLFHNMFNSSSCDTSNPSTSNPNKTINQTYDYKKDNVPCFSNNGNKLDAADKVTDADKLLQDLDFLNNAVLNTSDNSHPKLCKVLSVPGDESPATQMAGVKRTISEQNLRSKSEDKVLPPKKQTRYLNHQNSMDISHSSWGSEKCSHCQMSLLGLKVSRCLQGHPSCTTCLEEKVKVVLTGKAKETLHCLKPGCGSYFPLSELNHSLPKMVVDILETKLDDDYIDYIASMILKNATSSDDSAQNVTTLEIPDIPEVKKTSSVEMKQERDKDLPNNWTQMDKMKTYEMVVLEPESQEYIDVVFKFHESMKFPIADIVKISRIQNPILWQYYNVKRAQMILENEGLDVEERQLFHGTQTSIVESICKKGFDWRVCGKNGTVYGQGSYFAVNSSYSHQYTDKGNRRARLPRRNHSLMFKPPPAHSNIWCSLFQRQNQSQPFNPFSVGPSVINQSSYFIGSPQTSQQPPVVMGATQPSSCIMHGQQIPTQPSTANQQTLDQNTGGALLPGGNNINNQQPATQTTTKTVIINSQGAISLHKNVPNNLNFGNPNLVGISPQGTYGQPQVDTSLQGGYRPVQVNAKGGSSQVNTHVQGGYGQPQVFFPSNSSNCNLYQATKHEEDKPLHKMILSRVLVGRFTGGNANLRKPPPLYPDEDLYGKCYDSCVDHISEPKIFVIFDSAQAYPEYLIEYHMMNE